MSLNHITSSVTYNPWMNINCNDIKAQSFDVGTITADNLAITETKKSTIYGSLASGDELLQIKNTNSGANNFQVGLSVSNATDSSIKIVSQNTTNKGQIWTDGPFSLNVFDPAGSVEMIITGVTLLSGSLVGGVGVVNMPGRLAITNQPYLELQIPGALSVPNTVLTNITTLTNVIRNVGGITYSAGTFTVPSSGVYTISYGGQYVASGVGNGVRRLNISVLPSGTVYAGSSDSIGTNTDTSLLSSSVTLYLTPANTFVVQTQQTSGGALDLAVLDVIVYKCS